MPLELVAELLLDSGTQRFSRMGLSGPSKFYPERVISFGLASREVPVLPGEFQIGEISLELDNSNNFFSDLRGSTPFRNRKLRYLLGDPDKGESDFTEILSGKVDSWSLEENAFSLSALDDLFTKLEAPMVGLFDKATFPDLPGDPQVLFVPLVLGKVTSGGLSAVGALAASLIDPAVSQAKYRYAAGQATLKQILNVYVYGVLTASSNYTVSQQTFAGTEFTVIDFDTDQRDVTRSNESEITFDAEGLTDDGTTTGALLDNPADQFKELVKRNGFVDGDLDLTQFTEAAGVLSSRNIVGGVAVVQQESLRDVVEKFTESFNMFVYQSKDGLLAINIPEPTPTTAGLKELDESEIVLDSFTVEGAEDAASDVEFEYSRNLHTGEWQKSRAIRDATQQTNLGASIKRRAELWYVYDDTAANAVVNDRLFFLREERQVVEVLCATRFFRDVDIGDTVKLTHFAGIASGGAGYDKALFRVLGVGLDIEDTAIICRLRLVDLTAAVLSAASLDEFYPLWDTVETNFVGRFGPLRNVSPLPTVTPVGF